MKGRAPRFRRARTRCPRCGRDVAAYVPSGGDGTAYRVVAHIDPSVDDRCSGTLLVVDVGELTAEGFDGGREGTA